MSRQERLLLFILAAVQFTNIVDFMIVMPLGPQLMRLFTISPQQFGFIVSAYTLSAGVSGFAGAFWIDYFDRKKTLILIYIGFVIGTFACAFAPTYHILLAARIFTGAFGGILGALVMAIVGDAIALERRAAAMGIVMAAFSLASVFGVPFGLWLANLYSWHAPFIFLAAFSALNFIGILLFVPSLNVHLKDKALKGKTMDVITNVLRDNNQLLALLFMALLMLGQFTIIPFISPYMVSNVGFSEHQLTYIYLFGGLLTIFTSPVIGRMADKKGKSKVFVIFGTLFLIPLFLITNMPRIHIVFVLMATTSFFVFVSGRMIPAMAIITSTVPPQQRGSFMSINSAVQQMAAGLASLLAGCIISKDAVTGEYHHYALVGCIAMAASFTCVLIVRKLSSVN